jgi:hypothetical protein
MTGKIEGGGKVRRSFPTLSFSMRFVRRRTQESSNPNVVDYWIPGSPPLRVGAPE